MKIETLDDWNAIITGCGCCAMPSCPTPARICESVSGHLSASGYRNNDEETWHLYRRFGWHDTVVGKGDLFGNGSETVTGSAYEDASDVWDSLLVGAIANGEPHCTEWIQTSTHECESAGSMTRTFYDNWGEEDPPEPTTPASKNVTTRSTLTGESDDHVAWTAEHDDWQDEADAWDAINPDPVAWQTARDDHDAWTATAFIHDEWEAADPETRGDEPPEAGEEPLDPGPARPDEPEEPDHDWPPCSYRDTFTTTDLHEPPFFDPTTVHADGMSLTTAFSDGDFVRTPIYEFRSSFAEWRAEADAALRAALNFDTAECVVVGSCISTYESTPEPDGNTGESPEIAMEAARFRWRIPAEWKGSYFKITWQYLTEPEGFDATIPDPEYVPPETEPEGGWPEVPTIPDPAAPAPILSEDQTWTWAGPGDPEAPIGASWLSDWFIIPIPTGPGECRIVNIRYECYHSKLGNRPQTTGEGYAPPPA